VSRKVPFLGGAHRTRRSAPVLFYRSKKAQCFAPGWFYAGEMFDFFLETRPQSSSASRFTAGAAGFFILSQ
jgi:hypothetical protein